jgi:hypothetical protein
MTSQYARIILDCWQKQIPIPSDVTLQAIDDFIDYTPPIGGTDVDKNLPPPGNDWPSLF